MTSPELPLELLLMIAHHMRDDDGGLHYGDFNSFLQVNRVLYACLNHQLWKEATEHEVDTQRVLTQLIETNDLARLEFFLELGADVEVGLPAFEITGLFGERYDRYSDDTEPTPLIVAADSGNVPLARLLLEKGAKVQYTGQNGGSQFSPIHAARSAEMVQLLLDHDSDPNLDDGEGLQPLHWYANHGDIAAMREILRHGAEVNPNVQSEKPLHEAVQRSLDAVKLLLEYGADMDGRDHDGRTPLHFAAMAGKIDVVEFLVTRSHEAMRERDRDDFGETPLHVAAAKGKIDVVKLLLERWPQGMQAMDGGRTTPLHYAARAGETNVVRLLLERWPEGLRAKNGAGNTPLHLAAGFGLTVELVRLLAESWPEGVRERNVFGRTPLHMAAGLSTTEIVRFLVERWPEGKAALDHGFRTPLWIFEHEGIARPPLISDEDAADRIILLESP
jgi:ankyrin repeat protein